MTISQGWHGNLGNHPPILRRADRIADRGGRWDCEGSLETDTLGKSPTGGRPLQIL